MESMSLFQEGSCFLFDCGSPDDFFCLFDPNDTYMTGALEIDRHLFEETAKEHKDRHETQLKSFKDIPDIEDPKRGKAVFLI